MSQRSCPAAKSGNSFGCLALREACKFGRLIKVTFNKKRSTPSSIDRVKKAPICRTRHLEDGGVYIIKHVTKSSSVTIDYHYPSRLSWLEESQKSSVRLPY